MYRVHEILNSIKQELSTASVKNNTTETDLQAKILTVVEIPEEDIKHVSPSNEIDEIIFEKLREFHKAQSSMINPGDKVRNINTSCTHYGSEGVVEKLEALSDNMGNVVVYKTTNSGPTWDKGDTLKKTEVQLAGISIFPSVQQLEPMMMINDTMEDSNYLVSDLPINPDNIDSLHDIEMMDADDETDEEPSDELDEYKEDFYKMSVGSIKAIIIYAQQLLNSLDDPTVKENLTEAWLQSKIAITEDYMRTIYDFVMFFDQDDDTEETEASRKEIKHPRKKHLSVKKPINLSYRLLPVLRGPTVVQPPHNELTENHDEKNEENEEKEGETTTNNPVENESEGPSETSTPASHKPGLWENIRKKKEREGKKYKPAKVGDKDRPDPEAFKEAQK